MVAVTMAAAHEVEEAVKRAGTSFYQGMRLLPHNRRLAMYAIYAFCRDVDDIVDESATMEEKISGLQLWREKIDALYRSQASDSITSVLLQAVRDYGLRREDFLAVIDGMEMDAVSDIVAPSLAELDLYCDRVASAVGRLSVRAFGDASANADKVADALGRALQLTNILRDLVEDAERGRLYLPAEWLQEAGIATRQPDAVLNDPRVEIVCRKMAAQAAHWFEEAERAMRLCNRKAMRPSRLMGAMYSAILKRLNRRGWKTLSQPVKVPKLTKLWFIGRYGLI